MTLPDISGKIIVVKKIAVILVSFCLTTGIPAQNVGIGTNTPTQKLDVNGSIRIRQGNPGDGKVLTSDANGNASWRTVDAASGQSVGYGTWGDCSMSNLTGYNPVTDPAGALHDDLGFSVSISGTMAIAGAPMDQVGANIQQGSACIFEFNGTKWVFKQKLTDATGGANDHFGNTVHIAGNFTIVGAPNDDVGANADQGSACVYELIAGTWVFRSKITDATGAAGDQFGISVWIDHLSGLLIGAYQDDVGANNAQGSVIHYKYDGTNWNQSQKITDPSGAAGDFFGYSLSQHEANMVVGAYGDDSFEGIVVVFKFDGAAWSFVTRFGNPITPLANDYFGTSVSIWDNEILVGAPGVDQGITDQGKAYRYTNDGSNWTLSQIFTKEEAASGDSFGGAVFVSGDYMVIGASVDDISTNTNAGSATIYQKIGTRYERFQFTYDPRGEGGAHFGNDVEIDGSTGRFLVGVPNYEGGGKAIFGKVR